MLDDEKAEKEPQLLDGFDWVYPINPTKPNKKVKHCVDPIQALLKVRPQILGLLVS